MITRSSTLTKAELIEKINEVTSALWSLRADLEIARYNADKHSRMHSIYHGFLEDLIKDKIYTADGIDITYRIEKAFFK